ncbi:MULTISPECIES: hypothetical protein [unclassified Burkholderia]|uniref:hypothetical protein n=1 Tax=unclassified Burkholderia TaxID=2613784 RepID=UPI002AB11882|nr:MULTISPECIES: hypothetical protein [unclassified Burkholderia]
MFTKLKKRVSSKVLAQPQGESNQPAAGVLCPSQEFLSNMKAFGQQAELDAAAVDEVLRAALLDRSLVGILERIQAEQSALLAESGHGSELEAAARRSVSEGTSVRAALEARSRELHKARKQIIADRREKHAADAREAGPAMQRAVEQLWAAQTEARRLENLVSGFAAARLAWVERLRDTGLTEVEIAAIEVRPTDADREQWLVALEACREQERQLPERLRRGAAAFVAGE